MNPPKPRFHGVLSFVHSSIAFHVDNRIAPSSLATWFFPKSTAKVVQAISVTPHNQTNTHFLQLLQLRQLLQLLSTLR